VCLGWAGTHYIAQAGVKLSLLQISILSLVSKFNIFLLCVVGHACNPRTWEAEAGGSCFILLASQRYL
jgi:hypothetical protein